jgi:hypothetical protein
MPSRTELARIGDSGINGLDWVRKSHLETASDDNTGLSIEEGEIQPERLEVFFYDLPESPETRAFEAVANLFQLDPATVDNLPSDERDYFTCLTTAVANCVIPGPNGEICLLDPEEIQALSETAGGYPAGEDTVFLQDLANLAHDERRHLLGPKGRGSQNVYASAGEFMDHVIDRFYELREVG